MNLLLVFSLKFFDERSTFSRENKQTETDTKLHWSFCDNEKEVLPRIELGSLDLKCKMPNTTPSNLLNLGLVFCLTFRDKRSTFSRESKHRRNYTGVFVTMKKKILPRFELGSLDSKSKVLTTTPLKLMNLLLVFSLKFFDKRSTFSRENKQTRSYTGVF